VDDPFAAYYPPGISYSRNTAFRKSVARVAFGDSLTLHLPEPAAYLRLRWSLGDKDVPNILEQNSFKSWNVFYNYTNNYFQPFEQCDCVRVNT
jgi:hypothetical protein